MTPDELQLAEYMLREIGKSHGMPAKTLAFVGSLDHQLRTRHSLTIAQVKALTEIYRERTGG